MNLKKRLEQPKTLYALGIYDALTALIAEQAGFEAAFVSGSAVSYSQLARPDIGLVTLTEMALTVERIRDRINMHLLVDADSGFGNAFDVQRTVRTLERAGANGIQIEDQLNTKRPKDAATRPVIPVERMVGKIKAALDARLNDNTVISARTDSVFTLGIEQALDRANAFIEAGAEMVFVEGLKEQGDIERLVKLSDGRAPVLYNLLNPETLNPNQLRELGISMALYPGVIIDSIANSARTSVSELATALDLCDSALPKHQSINNIIGTPEYLRSANLYDNDSNE